MKIKAALLMEAGSKFVIEELTLQEPQAGEVLVKIAASGVCHSDYHVMSGTTKHPMPCVSNSRSSLVIA